MGASNRPETIDHRCSAIVAIAAVAASLIARGAVGDEPRAGLFAVDPEGANLRVIAAPDVGDDPFRRAAHPSWSPDGGRIAFTAFDPSGRRPEIRIVPSGGGLAEVVASGVAPSWSADGTRIAYMTSGKPAIATDWSRPGRNDERVEVVRLEGPDAGAIESVVEGVWPRWAPADDRLAFRLPPRGHLGHLRPLRLRARPQPADRRPRDGHRADLVARRRGGHLPLEPGGPLGPLSGRRRRLGRRPTPHQPPPAAKTARP